MLVVTLERTGQGAMEPSYMEPILPYIVLVSRDMNVDVRWREKKEHEREEKPHPGHHRVTAGPGVLRNPGITTSELAPGAVITVMPGGWTRPPPPVHGLPYALHVPVHSLAYNVVCSLSTTST